MTTSCVFGLMSKGCNIDQAKILNVLNVIDNYHCEFNNQIYVHLIYDLSSGIIASEIVCCKKRIPAHCCRIDYRNEPELAEVMAI